MKTNCTQILPFYKLVFCIHCFLFPVVYALFLEWVTGALVNNSFLNPFYILEVVFLPFGFYFIPFTCTFSLTLILSKLKPFSKNPFLVFFPTLLSNHLLVFLGYSLVVYLQDALSTFFILFYGLFALPLVGLVVYTITFCLSLLSKSSTSF